MDIFTNPQDRRARAGWRLLFQLMLMTLISGAAFWFFSVILPLRSPLSFALPNFIGILSSVWISARFMDKRPLSAYGLHLDNRWYKEFIAGTLVAAIAMGLIFLLEWSQNWIQITGFGWETSNNSFLGSIVLFLIAMLMVGFHEELFSRGYQILNLTEGLSYDKIGGTKGAVVIAVLLTSGLFGVLHMFNPGASWIAVFNIVLAGIVLAIPYIITGSLALSVGLHFSWNFFQAAVFGFPVSGLSFDTSVIELQQKGPTLLTGGDFGPEAGILGIAGMAIMLGGSIVYIKKAGYKLGIAEELRQNKITHAMASEE